MPIQIKRVYDPPHRDDGLRILVDRLWPRGLTKQAAAIDQWIKECAPSNELRKWFAHDPAKWAEFRQKYLAELKDEEELLAPVRALAGKQRVTLLFGAADVEHNNAVVLMEYLGTEGLGTKPKRNPAPRTVRH